MTNYIAFILMIFSSLVWAISSSAQYIPPDLERHWKAEPHENTIAGRFPPPENFDWVRYPLHSFADYLQKLPLKRKGSVVKYYNGQTKPSEGVYLAVLDMPIGDKNLHQCADAIIRLRAEYLYRLRRFDAIHFNFTNGFNAEYSKWKEGSRISVKGNTCSWIESSAPSTEVAVFEKYLEIVYMYAGSQSLEKELVPTDKAHIQVGDVFIQGGSPGHAVIVVNKAINQKTGEVAICLAQSYMPAQETQILSNPASAESPWYFIDQETETLNTPEWRFKVKELRRFPED